MTILMNLSSNAALLFFFIIAVILIGLSLNPKDDIEVIEHEDYHFDNQEIENENKKDNTVE